MLDHHPGGQCQNNADCDDGNACTTDTCDPMSIRRQRRPAASASDGAVCDRLPGVRRRISAAPDRSARSTDRPSRVTPTPTVTETGTPPPTSTPTAPTRRRRSAVTAHSIRARAATTATRSPATAATPDCTRVHRLRARSTPAPSASSAAAARRATRTSRPRSTPRATATSSPSAPAPTRSRSRSPSRCRSTPRPRGTVTVHTAGTAFDVRRSGVQIDGLTIQSDAGTAIAANTICPLGQATARCPGAAPT